MKRITRKVKRWLLIARIDCLRGDIAAANERVAHCEMSLASANDFLQRAHLRMRSMRARLALLDRGHEILARVGRLP